MLQEYDVFDVMCLWKQIDWLHGGNLVMLAQLYQISCLAQGITADVHDTVCTEPGEPPGNLGMQSGPRRIDDRV